ncbi:MAG TPA: hypothetical protein VM573_10370, partial [Actinomycetota bacterium]|nr:hypothetical protein [Actinomycetota bacterium]
MRRPMILTLAMALTLGVAPTTFAHHDLPTESFEGAGAGLPSMTIGETRAENMSLVANWNPEGFRQGSDLAFWGNLAVLGNYENPGGFRLVDISNPARPRQVGQFACQGDQADVSIWEDLVFVSVDRPMIDGTCKPAGHRANAADTTLGNAW